MINNSSAAIDVRVAGFTPSAVQCKRFVTNVLQLDLPGGWQPNPHGVDAIAVLPGKRFRAWVGLDESRFTPAQARGLKGNIGTLKLVVNGTPVLIKF
jgi:hypothetical protein